MKYNKSSILQIRDRKLKKTTNYNEITYYVTDFLILHYLSIL